MRKHILALHERELPWNPTNLQMPRLPSFPGKLPWAPWGKNRPCTRWSGELPVKILKLTVIAWAESSLQESHKLTTASVKFLPEFKLVLRLHVSSGCDLCNSWQKTPSSSGYMKHQELGGCALFIHVKPGKLRSQANNRPQNNTSQVPILAVLNMLFSNMVHSRPSMKNYKARKQSSGSTAKKGCSEGVPYRVLEGTTIGLYFLRHTLGKAATYWIIDMIARSQRNHFTMSCFFKVAI